MTLASLAEAVLIACHTTTGHSAALTVDLSVEATPVIPTEGRTVLGERRDLLVNTANLTTIQAGDVQFTVEHLPGTRATQRGTRSVRKTTIQVVNATHFVTHNLHTLALILDKEYQASLLEKC